MNKVSNIIWLIPFLPVLGFLINGLFRNSLSKSVSGIVGTGVIFLSFLTSLCVFISVKSGNIFNVEYFQLINIESFKVALNFKVDQLTSIFLLVITGVGSLIHLYSTSYMHEENSADFAKYFSYLNLFVFSMLLLVMGGNFIVMFAGWEGVGLCSYLLIGYWYKNVNFTSAAKKAFVMNRIGDFGFLLAIFWLIAKLGTVNFDEIFTTASLAKLTATDITGITLLLFLGATGKSAQIPLFTWLPDAMAGPTPVSALIHAATMVTAGIYMIARSNSLFSLAPITQNIIAVIGIATALVTAGVAMKQNDIKKVLAYSTVSQLGFMFIALGVGNYTAAVFHVVTHAFFKALLFLGSGSVIHAMGGEQDIRNMGGLHKYMKTTSVCFLIGCLAIAGIPGFSGFFSKDAILAGAYEHSSILFYLTLFAALLTAFYMFRLYILTFLGSFRGTHEQEHHLHESPRAITIPLILLAILSVIGGFVGVPESLGGHNEIAKFLSIIMPQETAHLSHSTEYFLMGLTTCLVIVSIIIAFSMYKKKTKFESSKGFANILENKWYFDELYDAIVARPLLAISNFLNNIIEKSGIDGFVNNIGRFVNYGGRQLRWVQSGNVGAYVLLMVIGMLFLFAMQLFTK